MVNLTIIVQHTYIRSYTDQKEELIHILRAYYFVRYNNRCLLCTVSNKYSLVTITRVFPTCIDFVS